MGVLKIQCYSSEIQMDTMESIVSELLYGQSFDFLSDIDQPFEDMRICVDFKKSIVGLELKSVEILDADWDMLYEDSAVLTSRLKVMVNEYNSHYKASCKQAFDIMNDQIN